MQALEAQVKKNLQILLTTIVVSVIGERVLGYYPPSKFSSRTSGGVWYAEDYVYCNHWHPGFVADAQVAPVEPIEKTPPQWFDKARDALAGRALLVGVMVILYWCILS